MEQPLTAPVFHAATDALGGDTVVLDGPEGHHAARVRRLRVGEDVVVVDGRGLRVSGAVTSVDRESVVIAVDSRAAEPPSSPRVVVVQALAKGDRGERAVEALAEVGVDEIVPWSAARSIALWSGDRGDRAVERWRSIGREASKQARRSWFPVVADLADTEEVARRVATAPLAVVCHESAEMRLAGVDPVGADEVLLVIGPEGGLTDDEVATFVAAGAQACRLGDTVLRTSTAGVVAASVVLARTRWTSWTR